MVINTKRGKGKLPLFCSITNDISMNDDETFIHKYYAPFLSSNNREVVSSRSEYASAKLRVFSNKTFFI